MKFRPGVPGAYAPAQAATAVDAGGRPVVLLFVPHWREAVRTAAAGAAAGGVLAAETQWAFSREVRLPLLFARFEGGQEVAVTFTPSMSREVLTWWERQGRVDVVFTAAPVQEVERPALGLEPVPDDAAFVRVRDVPFLTS